MNWNAKIPDGLFIAESEKQNKEILKVLIEQHNLKDTLTEKEYRFLFEEE